MVNRQRLANVDTCHASESVEGSVDEVVFGIADTEIKDPDKT